MPTSQDKMIQRRIFLLLLISIFHPSTFSSPIPDPDIVTPKSIDNLIHLKAEKTSAEDNADSVVSSIEEEFSPKQDKSHRKLERAVSSYSSSPDSIIFPSSYSSNVESYDLPFADRYNVHRPNIPVPERSMPFNFGNSGAQAPRWPVNPNARPFEPEIEDVQQQQEDQSPFLRPRGKKIDTSSVQFNFNDNEEDETTTVSTIQDEQGLNYQSLYSGPRVQKLPCPKGKYKTHGGRCNEKSYKLIFINDVVDKH